MKSCLSTSNEGWSCSYRLLSPRNTNTWIVYSTERTPQGLGLQTPVHDFKGWVCPWKGPGWIVPSWGSGPEKPLQLSPSLLSCTEAQAPTSGLCLSSVTGTSMLGLVYLHHWPLALLWTCLITVDSPSDLGSWLNLVTIPRLILLVGLRYHGTDPERFIN